jgi:hypothetical protein
MKARGQSHRAAAAFDQMARIRVRQIVRRGGSMRVPEEQIGLYRKIEDLRYFTIHAEPGGKWYGVSLTQAGEEFAR